MPKQVIPLLSDQVIEKPQLIILEEEEINLHLKCNMFNVLDPTKPAPVLLPLKSVCKSIGEHVDKIAVLEFSNQVSLGGDKNIELLLDYRELKKHVPEVTISTQLFTFDVEQFSDLDDNKYTLGLPQAELLKNEDSMNPL